MSLILIDGMEDLSSWVPSITQTDPAGRNGTCYSPTFTQNAVFTIPTASESTELHIGFAYKATAINAGIITRFKSDANATDHVDLAVNSDGSLAVSRGGTVLGTSAASVITATNTWHYIEYAALLSDTVGTYAVSVNGTSVLTGSSADTKNAGTKTVFDTVVLTVTTNIQAFFDDLYLMSGAGDSFLGDMVVETLYPNGDGNVNQFVGSDGNSVSNYLLVNENPASSTQYTGSATSAEQDKYTLTDLVRTSGTIVGICHASYTAKSDAGSKTYKIVNRRAADNKSAALTPTTSYVNGHYVLTVDPETSAAWTIANVNALQSGVEVV